MNIFESPAMLTPTQRERIERLRLFIPGMGWQRKRFVDLVGGFKISNPPLVSGLYLLVRLDNGAVLLRYFDAPSKLWKLDGPVSTPMHGPMMIPQRYRWYGAAQQLVKVKEIRKTR